MRKREVRVCLRLTWQSTGGGKAGASDPCNLIQADLRLGKGHETLNLHRKRSLRRAFLLCCLVKGLGTRSSDIVAMEDEDGRAADWNDELPTVLEDRLETVQFFVTFK